MAARFRARVDGEIPKDVAAISFGERRHGRTMAHPVELGAVEAGEVHVEIPHDEPIGGLTPGSSFELYARVRAHEGGYRYETVATGVVGDVLEAPPAPAAFPSAPGGAEELAPLIDDWRRTAEWHRWEAPAGEPDVAAAEEAIGASFPPALRALYRMSDGLSLFGGRLNVSRLALVVDANAEFSASLPDDVRLFGDDGDVTSYGFSAGEGVVAWVEGEPQVAPVAPDVLSFLRRATEEELERLRAAGEEGAAHPRPLS